MRSFFSAFFASGSRDLLAVMSKEKMLQFEPSSCGACQDLVRLAKGLSTWCIHAWCHCAGSIWTGRHRRRRRKSMGTQDPWRLQMRRRTLGNPWRQCTLRGQMRWLATHRRKGMRGRAVAGGRRNMKSQVGCEGVLAAEDTAAASGIRLPRLLTLPLIPPPKLSGLMGTRSRSDQRQQLTGTVGSPR